MNPLKKLLHPTKQNPYSDPTHPYNYKPQRPPPSTSQTPEPQDLLAEARSACGRDRVTGKPLPPHPQTSSYHLSTSASTPNLRDSASRSASGAATHAARAGSKATEVEPGCYQAGQKRRGLGTRYDLFVEEMKAKRRAGGGVRERERVLVEGYYAPPPRQVTEYYAPGSGREW